MALTLDQTYDLAIYILRADHEGRRPPVDSSGTEALERELLESNDVALTESQAHDLALYVLDSVAKSTIEAERHVPPSRPPLDVLDNPPPHEPTLHSLISAMSGTRNAFSTSRQEIVASAEPSSVLGKRRREPAIFEPPAASTSIAAPKHPTVDAMTCIWPGCTETASPPQLFAHIKSAHGKTGFQSIPDEFRCGWDGCAVVGTTAQLTRHFKEVHDEKQTVKAKYLEAKVECKVTGCGRLLSRGKDFKRHLYGLHWMDTQYYRFCETCGKLKRVDQHHDAAKCLAEWMEANYKSY
ncbi:uncharacterized protein C8Q71DRAFT_725014 [Rhodofomes roseus]|uniref:C2H2-type domain-containing protein n=1 Tax=Rhodofomes roseus TaxID=34475 RepID=A0ABQ8KAK5_9APHY|nr:uncharacterized protein C8Q71DRAFT_725014 [Rhodofomes roseus]KAH9834418.1 hypothetical protein C8Q71DRAFT_725014 [Rhodofomes roseus]